MEGYHLNCIGSISLTSRNVIREIGLAVADKRFNQKVQRNGVGGNRFTF